MINSLIQDFSGAFIAGLSIISLQLIVMYPVVSKEVSLDQCKSTENVCSEFIDKTKRILSMLFKDN